MIGAELGVPVIAGSDAHRMFQVGCVYNQFEGDFETLTELKEVIRSGAYKRLISSSLDLQVRAANYVKKLLKKKVEVVV